MNFKDTLKADLVTKYSPWIILSVISISLFVYSTWCGLGITYDSKDYLYAAESWSKNYTLLNANQTVFQERTPLFPLLLSCLALNSSLILLAFGISYLLILNSTLYIFSKNVQSVSQRVYFSVLLACSPPLLLITNYLWSEVFFTLLLLISTYFILQFSEKQTNYKTLAIATVLSFLYCIQRNTGIFFVMGSAIFLLIESQNKKMFFYVFIYSTLALSGWGAWTLYHYFQRGLDFQPTLYEIGENIFPNIITYIERFSLWLLPTTINTFTRLISCCSLLIILIVLTVEFLRKHYVSPKGKIVLYLLILIINYIGGMSLLEKVNEWEADRFIAILYPFCILILGIIINEHVKQKTNAQKITIQVILCIYLFYPCIRSLKICHFWNKNHCKNTSITTQNKPF